MQGRLGLDLARHSQPDVIVLDLHLPDLSGEEILRRLSSDPKTAEIPVIVLSADASSGQERTVRALGAAAYVTKPLDISTFLDALDETLSTRASILQ
jgi:CheY-like chemotaxis protein